MKNENQKKKKNGHTKMLHQKTLDKKEFSKYGE